MTPGCRRKDRLKTLFQADHLYRSYFFKHFCCCRDIRKSVDFCGELFWLYMNERGVLFFLDKFSTDLVDYVHIK